MSRSVRDEALALALARGLTVTDAAKEAGVSRATATRRLAEDGFDDRVRELRQEMFNRATGQAADALGDAVAALRALLQSDHDTTRLRAASTLLSEAVRLHESLSLASRVDVLEGWAKHLTNLEDDAEPTNFRRSR